MDRKELVSTINEALAPYRKAMEDMDSVIMSVMEEVQNMQGFSDLSKQELRTYIVDKMSDTRLDLMRDRDQFRGEKGEKGEKGEIGQRGDIGERGEKGDKGEPGQRGEIGERGEKGDQGEKGDRGYAGKDGEKGERGLKGEHGERGEKGEKGDRGYTGKDGKNGDRGYRGEKGERGDTGRSGEKGEKGDKGDRGYLTVTSGWTAGQYPAGDTVNHKGGLWQARRVTKSEPNIIANDWELLVDGIDKIESSNTEISIKMSSGQVVKTGMLLGPQGPQGDSVVLHKAYDNTYLYRKNLDEVKESGGVWRAIKDGLLHKPGTQKGQGQWINIAHKGAKGDPGKDADQEAIRDEVIQHFALETKALLDMTIKQVDEYFDGMTLDV